MRREIESLVNRLYFERRRLAGGSRGRPSRRRRARGCCGSRSWRPSWTPCPGGAFSRCLRATPPDAMSARRSWDSPPAPPLRRRRRGHAPSARRPQAAAPHARPVPQRHLPDHLVRPSPAARCVDIELVLAFGDNSFSEPLAPGRARGLVHRPGRQLPGRRDVRRPHRPAGRVPGDVPALPGRHAVPRASAAATRTTIARPIPGTPTRTIRSQARTGLTRPAWRRQ